MQLLLLGDVNIQHRADPASAFARLRHELDHADVRFANMEGLFDTPGDADTPDIPDKPHWRHSHFSQITALRDARFDALGGANNVNFGPAAISRTLAGLDSFHIPVTGLGRDDADAYRAVFRDTAHGRLAFVQATARYYGRDAWAGVDRPGVMGFDPDDPVSTERIINLVRDAAQHADVTVFSHHLRLTGHDTPEPYQHTLAAAAVAAGASVVIGHGAHVNQPINHIDRVPVFHCVGQGPFDWFRNANKKDGQLVLLEIEGGRITDVCFKLLHRDAAGLSYITPRDDPEHRRQIDALRVMSPNVRLREAGDDAYTVEPA